jgi:hypothetical protein
VFGYVRISRPQLRCAEHDLYRGVYCSLCKELGARYGPLARLILPYDAVFYALFALAQQEKPPVLRPSRCSFNPAKRCLRCEKRNKALVTAADISMLMVYYKWRDTIADEAGLRRLLWLLPAPFFLCSGRRAKRLAPEAAKKIKSACAAQRIVERKEAPCLDECAHPSAQALGELLAATAESAKHAAALRRLGYLLGRWVYLMDAADDLEQDRKRGRFNPFSAHFDQPEAERRAFLQAQLNQTAEELLAAWEAVPLQRYRPIFDNLFTLGLPAMEATVLHTTRKERKRRAGSL